MPEPFFDFKIEGARGLDEVLAGLPKSFEKKQLKAALKKVAKPAVKEARAKARRSKIGTRPHKGVKGGPPGAAAASIRAFVMTKTIVPAAIAIGPDEDHWYLTFQEFGTPQRAAEPFLRPAFDMNKRSMIRNFTRDMFEVLNRTAMRLKKQAYAGKLSRPARKALGI